MGNITIIPKYVDFNEAIKELHKKICTEIAFIMAATGVKELNSFTYDYNINILHNQYVIPCSVQELYETVFEKCVKNNEKK